MELFRLFGTISVNNSEANKNIDATSERAESTGSKLSSLGGKFTKVGDGITSVGKKMLPVSAAIGGIGGLSVKTAATFEESMSQVAATMGMTAEEINNGSEEYKKLENAARECGKKTKFSADESAQALNYLALAGYDVDKSVATLPTVLNLAAAGGIDLAYASDMVTDSMSALGDTAGTTESFVDKMAKTSQKSNTSVAQLGEAILTVGGTAKTMSGGVTEMNTCLGILADNGVKGAEGGTALRNIILSLSAPTDTAAKTMKALGLEVFDADGKMRPLNETFKDLDNKLSKMNDKDKTDVLNTIFNKVDLKSANALLSNCGDRFDDLSGMIDKSEGAAQNMAETMQNNLNGKITTLKSALSEAAISIGDKLCPMINKAVVRVQEWTDWFNGLNDSQRELIIKVAGIVAAIPPLLIVIGKMSTGVGGLMKIGSKLPSMFSAVGGVIGGLSAPVVAIIGVIALLVGAFVYLWNTNEGFRDKIISIWNRIKSVFEKFTQGIVDRLNALGFDFENITEVIMAVWQGLCDFLAPVFESVFTEIANFFEYVCGIVTGVLDVFVGLFTGDWDRCWNGIKEIFKSVWDFIVNTFSAVGDMLIGIADVILGWFGTSWNEVWTGISDFFIGIWDAICGFFQTCADVMSGIWDTICNAVQVAIMFIGSIIKAAFDIITLPFRFIWENCKDTIIKVWNTIKNTVTKGINAVKNVITTVMNAVKKVWTTVWNAIVNFFTPIINGIKSTVSTVFNAIKNTISKVWNGVKDTTTKVWNSIKDGVSTVVNGIKNTVSSVFNGIKNTVSSVWNGIKDAISKPITAAKNTVSNMIDKIKEKFNFKWEFPKLKLPHFKIDGKFSLSPPSVPKLAIDWYAKAMDEPYMFTEPTIVGNKGFGEAGDEIVYGRKNLMEDIRDSIPQPDTLALQEKMNRIIELLEQLLGMNITLDSDVLVGRLAPAMDTALGTIYEGRSRGGRTEW